MAHLMALAAFGVAACLVALVVWSNYFVAAKPERWHRLFNERVLTRVLIVGLVIAATVVAVLSLAHAGHHAIRIAVGVALVVLFVPWRLRVTARRRGRG